MELSYFAAATLVLLIVPVAAQNPGVRLWHHQIESPRGKALSRGN
jgi:hypothetical protein